MDRSLLKKIRDNYKEKLDIRINNNERICKEILVCGGTGCTSNHSDLIIKKLNELIKSKKLNNVKVVRTGCFGLCAKGPIIIIRPKDTFYSLAKIEDMEEIIIEDIINNRIVERLLCKDIDNKVVKRLDDLNFYKKQNRRVLRNCGLIDPENIFEYIGRDGYSALEKCLYTLKKEEIINIIKESELRGRGGAGFRTGLKWEMAFMENNPSKYVACNADEGDPGAFMDRSILEGDPHSVIEAMIIAGYAISATHGVIYVRKEYPIAVSRLEIALNSARENGLLGKNILDSGFNFDIELRLGSGAFVCGEETALMASCEGKRGEPRLRPPYPTHMGLFNVPTVLNNVETYANICQIILNGADWFKSVGVLNNYGTKVFALGGKVHNTGLIEVPMGTTLREIVFDIGGGIPNGKEFKMAQTGGPSGGCIPASLLDTPMDYDSLSKIGSMMGSGGLIVMDTDTCALDIAKYFLDFTVGESCGKCTPCRIGNKRLYELLDKMTKGTATIEDLEKIEDLANYVKENSLCGLGQTSPNPILSTLRYFKDEYIEHIENKNCPSKACKSLIKYEINKDLCIGCSLCKRNCPNNAIEGNLKEAHTIDQSKCIKCGLCFSKCPKKAIERN